MLNLEPQAQFKTWVTPSFFKATLFKAPVLKGQRDQQRYNNINKTTGENSQRCLQNHLSKPGSLEIAVLNGQIGMQANGRMDG